MSASFTIKIFLITKFIIRLILVAIDAWWKKNWWESFGNRMNAPINIFIVEWWHSLSFISSFSVVSLVVFFSFSVSFSGLLLWMREIFLNMLMKITINGKPFFRARANGCTPRYSAFDICAEICLANTSVFNNIISLLLFCVFSAFSSHLNGYCHYINKDREWMREKKFCVALTTMARRSTSIYFGGKSEGKKRERLKCVACFCLISFSASYCCIGCLSLSNNAIVISFSPSSLCSPIIAIS